MSKVRINGWALLFHDSTILHALPAPTDLGDNGPAMCGHGCARGWSEPPQGRSLFPCSPCLTQLSKLADENQLHAADLKKLRSDGLLT